MKYCERYAALLDLFVDGELTLEEMERVQAHLETCPGCRAYVDDALAIRAGFPDVEDTDVPEGFTEGVMACVRREAETERKAVGLRRRSAWRWAGTLGALAACCALVILVRTGPGGLNGSGSDSAAMVTASSGAAASADCAMDTGGTDGSADEAGIAPQMAMEPAEAPELASAEEGTEPIEGSLEPRMSREKTDAGGSEQAASPSGHDGSAAGSPMEEVLGTSAGAADDNGAVLYLTAEEAGDLLDGFAPAWEAGPEKGYELSAEEYGRLLEALGQGDEILTEAAVLVVVTGTD